MMMHIDENEQMVMIELDEEELEEVSGGRHVTSTGNGVNVREEPTTKSRSLGKVYKGDKLTYAGHKKQVDGNTWYKVKYGGGYGWICGKYAKLS